MENITMPKSCISVLMQLEMSGVQTHKDLVLSTGLAPRTVRYALRRLKSEGLVVEKFNFRDARQSMYYPTRITAQAPAAA
ncbi:MAG TPA: helix-turn-helix domain-containing protein [Methanocorpusculum sp.]|nr:helix-turn-helix domain-containing protein [Methanocorpusculum sp.]HJJ46131.1 helix-turn-helix domain-containing protein [Methanocorpusculum sp.]